MTQIHTNLSLVFNPVERINVHDSNAPSRVKEARINGTPIVLVGHVGWADFAKRWISRKDKFDDMAKKKVDDIKNGGDAGNDENAVTVVVDVDKGTTDIMDVDKEVSAEQIDGIAAATLDSETNGQNSLSSSGIGTDGASNERTLDNDKPNYYASRSSGSFVAKTESMQQASCTSTGEKTTLQLNGFATGCNGEAAKNEVITSATDNGAPKTSAKSNGETHTIVSPSDKEHGEKKEEIVAAEEILPNSANSSNDIESSPLDLSRRDYYLDVKKMIADIGEEDVPVIKRHYNEENPIHGNIHAAKFLTNCWPSEEADDDAAKNQKTSPNLYLHQWQFPLSDTAGRKLCHKNNPLPREIMGEDLLKFWLDLPQCKFDSPLQYIFMGREDTLSKLHKDPGGLDISIAPIVGEKECVLVHRADGSNCLYHLTASLNDIDLHQYPLLSQAKIWKTTIQPGEILLMPQGTYHQCRNISPCLSYSRFHLDTVNLLPFVESLINGDAPEIDQEEILWNLTTELISKVDTAVDHTQSLVKQQLHIKDDISEDLVETVDILRALRHFVREVARRHEIEQQLKGVEVNPDHCFGTLVDDVDMVSRSPQIQISSFLYHSMLHFYLPTCVSAYTNSVSER